MLPTASAAKWFVLANSLLYCSTLFALVFKLMNAILLSNSYNNGSFKIQSLL